MNLVYKISFIIIVLAATPAPCRGTQKTVDSTSQAALAHRLAAMAGPRDAVVIASPSGSLITQVHADLELVPASILKLLSTLAALEKLGPDFSFRTDFYLTAENDLKIKGYGDPLLISEELKAIAEHLASRVPTIRNLVLDDAYFEQPVRIPGRGSSPEPYDAPNGALCVNFNTVAFKRQNGIWLTDEAQTPLLPSVIPKIEASGLTRGRITLAANSLEALQYTGELFQFFFRQAGMQITGGVERGWVDTRADRLVWTHHGRRELSGAVEDLLEYSNNFIANQILLAMGAEALGPPATIDKGLKILEKFYRETLKINSGRIVEASGISRQNRITARAMLTILQHYEPYRELMRHQGREYYKTGHLKGIRTRAGFLAGAKGGFYRYAIIINTPGKTTHRMMRVIEKFCP